MQVMTSSGTYTARTVSGGVAEPAGSAATLARMQLNRTTIAAAVGAAVLAIGGGVAVFSGGSATTTTTTTTTTTQPTTTTAEVPSTLSALTGLPASDDIRARPVVAIKFDNVDGKATPQIGINQADVVYEIQVEGQITRLLALFQSEDAGPIGPVRSARGSEVPLLEELNKPLFTWHGANGILGPIVRASTVQPRSIDDIPQLFSRRAGRPSPYNSFVSSSADIRATADPGSTGPTTPIFSFAEPGEAASPGAAPATTVTIRFPPPFGRGGGEAPVTYKWNDGKWRREQGGHLHVDEAGEQVAVENVVVRFTNAIDSGTVDKSGTRVPTAEVVGQGEVWVFTNGTVTTGLWSKPDNLTRTTYIDNAGNEIKLTPGKTWVSMPYLKGDSSFR